MKIYLENIDEMNEFAKILGSVLKEGDVIDLIGDLGAGKTTLVQGMKKVFNVKADITSPTFSIVNIYDGDVKIYHLDLYRFDSPYEIEQLDYMEYFYPENAITFLEWSENVKGYLPEDRIRIYIDYEKEGRKIRILEENLREKEVVRDINDNFRN